MDFKIRSEDSKDFFEAERVCQEAFYNVYMPGCEEHLLLHDLRNDEAYLPSLSRIALVDNHIAGGIYYEKAYFMPQNRAEEEVLSFGPLFVKPEFQKKGLGDKLVLSTLALARTRGYKAVIITGVPTYYPRFGFKSCFELNLKMDGGEQFPALLGLSLKDGYLEKCGGGIFKESKIMITRKSQKEIDEFDALFPALEKKKLPGQWKSPNK